MRLERLAPRLKAIWYEVWTNTSITLLAKCLPAMAIRCVRRRGLGSSHNRKILVDQNIKGDVESIGDFFRVSYKSPRPNVMVTG